MLLIKKSLTDGCNLIILELFFLFLSHRLFNYTDIVFERLK